MYFSAWTVRSEAIRPHVEPTISLSVEHNTQPSGPTSESAPGLTPVAGREGAPGLELEIPFPLLAVECGSPPIVNQCRRDTITAEIEGDRPTSARDVQDSRATIERPPSESLNEPLDEHGGALCMRGLVVRVGRVTAFLRHLQPRLPSLRHPGSALRLDIHARMTKLATDAHAAP
eukprot:5719904-Pleurochrysis_carterae.AAC.1